MFSVVDTFCSIWFFVTAATGGLDKSSCGLRLTVRILEVLWVIPGLLLLGVFGGVKDGTTEETIETRFLSVLAGLLASSSELKC